VCHNTTCFDAQIEDKSLCNKQSESFGGVEQSHHIVGLLSSQKRSCVHCEAGWNMHQKYYACQSREPREIQIFVLIHFI